MLALIYFALAVLVGDFLCRRFYQFESAAHRCAAAILVGLVVSSWFTYLAGLAFFWTPQPLLWADLLFFVAAVALLSWPKWKGRILKSTSGEAHLERSNLYLTRPEGSSIADWLLIAGYVVLVSWMMFASFNTSGGKLQIANPEYSDFGPNTALIQSFAVGHNFPTEYPHFSGDRIRYHFLFYFQAGNLEFLGLNPAWSLNLLSITTLVSMLMIVMTLGEVLFNSRAVGRLGSLLFFFFGYLSYVPFLRKQASVRAAIEAITHQRDYLPTIFPWRGEAWGTWSQVTYLNQRHFATAIGIFFLVLVFLAIRYRAVAAKRAEARAAANTAIAQPDESPDTESMPVTANPGAPEDVREPQADTRVVAAVTDESPDTGSKPVTESGVSPDTGSMPVTVNPAAPEEVREPQAEIPAVAVLEPTHGTEITREPFLATLPPFIFSGALLGLLPMFNSAVFLAAAAVLGVLFLLFSLRGQMLVLAATSGVIALPQMLYLSTGSDRAQMPKLLHWGYTVEHPTVANVAKYLGFTFGFKWLLIALALVFATSLQRRFFLAFLSLIAVAFSFQFTIEVLGNQKFIHIWVIVANLFVAFGLWRLWRFSLGGTTLPGKFVAIVLFLLVVSGGIIDFFPIHNTGWSEVTYRNDALIDWLNKNTTPRDIFLTDRFVNHPILMAGRRVFYGWPYYAWSAGFDAAKRDKVYTTLFESRDPWKVFHVLKENGIRYVAFDGAIRQAQFIKRPNEELYATYFPKVFEDKQNNYNSMTIYKVPDTAPPNLTALPEAVSNMFEGGRGTGKGEFDLPVGIAVDRNGNFLVADTNNGRLEKFSPTGTFLDVIGTKGSGQGQLGAPNGIAVDHSGNIYVADAGNHRVEKLSADGKLTAEWRGPDVGFYGPRRIAIGSDDSVYVVDQGRTRIVKFSPSGQVLTAWGTKGTGDGQFDDPASVAVDPRDNKVYVADPRNKRIQVFDSDGKFVTKWIVPEWGGPYGFEDVAIDPKTGRLYASSTHMNTVLIFDLNGNRIGSLRPKPPDTLDGPSALALANGKMYVLNMLGNRVTVIDL
jgi:DNA-binding beta-propeller fold protein YncE/cbb3-type cytochrome oxidase subunit 3